MCCHHGFILSEHVYSSARKKANKQWKEFRFTHKELLLQGVILRVAESEKPSLLNKLIYTFQQSKTSVFFLSGRQFFLCTTTEKKKLSCLV